MEEQYKKWKPRRFRCASTRKREEELVRLLQKDKERIERIIQKIKTDFLK